MMNYPENPERMIQNLKHLHTIQSLNMSTLMMMNFAGFSMPDRMIRGTVDVWWRGTPNLAIMLILANILSSDPLWLGTRLRILRVVQPNENIRDMEQEMRDLLESSRIEAEVEMIRTAEDFRTVIRSKSADSAALFLGFLLQNDDEQNCRAFERLSSYLAGMPPAFIVCGAGGGADLNA